MDIIDRLFQYIQDQNLEALKNNKEKHTLLVEEKIKSLKEQGGDINPQDKDTNLTLLHFIVSVMLDNRLLDYFTASDIKQSADALLPAAALEENLEALTWLLDQGVDINEQDMDGNTALHEAVSKCNLDIINLLLDKGADVNIRNLNRESPLNALFCDRVVMASDYPTDESMIIITKLLIDKGAAVDSVAIYGHGNPQYHLSLDDYVPLLNQVIDFPFEDNKSPFRAIFLIVSKLKYGLINFGNTENILDFLTEEDNIDQIFAQEEDLSLKISVADNLCKILSQFNHTNKNQKVKEIQDYILNKRSVLVRSAKKTEANLEIDFKSQLSEVLKDLTIDTKTAKRKSESEESIDNIKKPFIASSIDNQEPKTIIPLLTDHNMDLSGDTEHDTEIS